MGHHLPTLTIISMLQALPLGIAVVTLASILSGYLLKPGKWLAGQQAHNVKPAIPVHVIPLESSNPCQVALQETMLHRRFRSATPSRVAGPSSCWCNLGMYKLEDGDAVAILRAANQCTNCGGTMCL